MNSINRFSKIIYVTVSLALIVILSALAANAHAAMNYTHEFFGNDLPPEIKTLVLVNGDCYPLDGSGLDDHFPGYWPGPSDGGVWRLRSGSGTFSMARLFIGDDGSTGDACRPFLFNNGVTMTARVRVRPNPNANATLAVGLCTKKELFVNHDSAYVFCNPGYTLCQGDWTTFSYNASQTEFKCTTIPPGGWQTIQIQYVPPNPPQGAKINFYVNGQLRTHTLRIPNDQDDSMGLFIEAAWAFGDEGIIDIDFVSISQGISN